MRRREKAVGTDSRLAGWWGSSFWDQQCTQPLSDAASCKGNNVDHVRSNDVATNMAASGRDGVSTYWILRDCGNDGWVVAMGRSLDDEL